MPDQRSTQSQAAPGGQSTASKRRRSHEAVAGATEAEASSPDTMLTLHRARFVKWSPTAVVALRAAGDGTVVAVARENGDLEFYETEYWTLVQRFSGQSGTAITSLEWVQTPSDGWRLFSAGLDGQLTEWNPRACSRLATTDSYGGAVWGMAAEPSAGTDRTAGGDDEDGEGDGGRDERIAVACDDGCLRIFAVADSEQGAQYRKSFAKTAGRMLSVAWSPAGDNIVSGSSDGCIRVWSPENGQELRRITAALEDDEDMCIWSVAVLPQGELVSGDSSGRVAVWDPQFGTLVHGFQRHAADVMQVAAAPDGNTIFASGVDSQVAAFRCLRAAPGSGNSDRWVYLDCKRPHTHDVRAMDIVPQSSNRDPLLISGGNDAQLFCFSVPAFQKVHAVRVCKCPQKPIVGTGCPAGPLGQPLLLSAQQSSVDVWRLGATGEPEAAGGKEGDFLDVAEQPVHLASIEASGRLMAAALSPDGATVAVSTLKKVTVCRVEQLGGREVEVTKQAAPRGLLPACHLSFSGDNSLLLSCSLEGIVQVVDLQSMEITAEFDQVKVGGSKAPSSALGRASAPAVTLAVDADGKWGAVVCSRTVHLLSLKGPVPTYHGRVPAPKHVSPITAAAFTSKGDSMVVSTAGNHIALFQVETCLAVPYWHKDPSKEMESRLESMPGSIVGLSFPPGRHDQRMVAYTSSGFCLVDFSKPIQSTAEASKGPMNKRRRAREWREKQAESAASGVGGKRGENVRVVNLVEPCLYMGYLSDSAAVLVEQPWSDVLEAFAPPLYKHRYGT